MPEERVVRSGTVDALHLLLVPVVRVVGHQGAPVQTRREHHRAGQHEAHHGRRLGLGVARPLLVLVREVPVQVFVVGVEPAQRAAAVPCGNRNARFSTDARDADDFGGRV